MITASIVTYNNHLLDFEAALRSLVHSPINKVYIVDHSDRVMDLELELEEYIKSDETFLRHREKGFEIEYIRHKNTGYGAGNNLAIRRAISEGSNYHLVMNPDVWFGPDVIPALWKHMEENPSVGQMMPKVLFLNGDIQRLAKMAPSPLDLFCRMCMPEFMFKRRNAKFELQDSNLNEILDVPCLSGCFMFFRTSALEEVGMFDERYFMYGEDFDITRRMHRTYKTIFYPKVHIHHKFNRASHKHFYMRMVHLTNMVRYFNKWGWILDRERRKFNRRLTAEINIKKNHRNDKQ